MKKGNLAVPSLSLLAADLKPETFCRFGVDILTATPVFETFAVDVAIFYIRVCFVTHSSFPHVGNRPSSTTDITDGFYIGIQDLERLDRT